MSQEIEQDRHRIDLGPDLNGVDEDGQYVEAGNDPFGDANPGACNPDATECDVDPHVLDAPPERSQVDMIEEAMEPFVGEKTVLGISPEDGLPVPLNEGSELHEAPPLRYDNFICVEDARSYVELFVDEFGTEPGAMVKASELASAQRSVLKNSGRYESNGSLRARREFPPKDVENGFGLSYVRTGESEIAIVRPIRPRCEHLRRQVLNADGIPEGERGHLLVFRNCAIRRSVGGALMSLRDQAVYACDYRSPPDPESVKKYLDEPEKRKLGETPVRLPMFVGPPVPLPDLD